MVVEVVATAVVVDDDGVGSGAGGGGAERAISGGRRLVARNFDFSGSRVLGERKF